MRTFSTQTTEHSIVGYSRIKSGPVFERINWKYLTQNITNGAVVVWATKTVNMGKVRKYVT
jgi:hypothetical protein